MHNLTVQSTGVPSPRTPIAGVGRFPSHHDQVLIVDDDGSLANAMAELLELAGFSVVLASDATFGLAALRTRQFAIVLSDQRMPGQTGVEMLLAARSEGLLDDVAVLIVSGEDLFDSPWRALRKPILFADLLVEMRQAVDLLEPR